MKNKRFLYLAIFLIGFLAISCVSASEITKDIDKNNGNIAMENVEINNDNLESDDIELIDGWENDEINDKDNFFLKSSSNSNILTENNLEGNFTGLAIEIEKADGELNLTRNYIFSNEDSLYVDGLIINKSITINGNGFIIDSRNHKAFNITSKNVILNNISFVNSSSSLGGAIYWCGANGILNNCSFINSNSNLNFSFYEKYKPSAYTPANGSGIQSYFFNQGLSNSFYGGAVYWSGDNGTINDCNFVNCTILSSVSIGFFGNLSRVSSSVGIISYFYGGAIYWCGAKGKCINCKFINCSIFSNSLTNTSMIHVNGSGCENRNNLVDYCCGGAICWNSSNGIISNCSFINSTCLSEHSVNASISGEKFGTCDSLSRFYSYGGAIFINGSNNVLDNDDFINSFIITDSKHYSSQGVSSSQTFSFGGALACEGFNNSLTNSKFFNSNSLSNTSAFHGINFYSYGGAICWNSSNSIISNCSFIYSNLKSNASRRISKINSYNLGGAIYSLGDNTTLSNCSFINSIADYYVVPYSTLIDSVTESSGGAIYWAGRNGTLMNCNFVNSSAVNGSNAIYWCGLDGYLLNYTLDSYLDQIIISSKLRIPIKTEITWDSQNMLIDGLKVIKPYSPTGTYGIVNIYLDDILSRTVSIGRNYTLSDISLGKHNVTIIYEGDSNFEPCNFSTEFYVMSVYPIVINDTSVIYYPNKYFQAKFYDINGEVLVNKLVIFKINNTDYSSITNSEGIAYLNADLYYGNYSITIINPMYNEEKMINLLVFTSIESEDLMLENGQNFTFAAKFLDNNAEPLKNNYVMFKINNKEYAIQTNENGLGSLNIDLSNGTYDIVLENPITDESKINKIIIGVDSSSGSNVDNNISNAVISLDSEDGSSILVTLKNLQDQPINNAIVLYSINGDEYNTLITNKTGQGIIQVNDNSTVNVIYTDEFGLNVTSSLKTIVVTNTIIKYVNTSDETPVTPNAVIEFVTNENYVTVSLKDIGGDVLTNRVISVSVNGINSTMITNNKGEASLMVSDNYSINVVYTDDFGASVSASLINSVVNNAVTEYINNTKEVPVTANASIDLTIKDNMVKVTLTDLDGKAITDNITVIANGIQNQYITGKEGTASIPIGKNSLMKVIYTDDNGATVSASIMNSGVTQAITRKATQIICENMKTVTVDPKSDGKNGDYFIWRLVDENGKPITNTPMQIGFNGKVYTYEEHGICTDNDGYARLQINLGYKGDYTFAICFLGDDNYKGAFAVAKITVDTQTGSLTVPTKSYNRNAKTKALTATFKTQRGKLVIGKKLTFIVNGKKYTATTNDQGVATVNVSLNKKGTYNFTVKYGGDSTYAAISQKGKLTIN